MRKNVALVLIAAAVVLWTLSGPTWFARGAIGRAMTNLDIWAQIHLPYPVLTLVLVGFIVTCGTIWFRRHINEERDANGAWSRKT